MQGGRDRAEYETGVAATRTLCFLIALVAFSLLRPAYGADAEPPFTLSLSISDEQTHPVPDAFVEMRLQGRMAASGTTDAAGSARLTLPRAGSYMLTVKKQGYITIQTTLQVDAANGRDGIEVILPSAELSQQTIEVRATSSAIEAETSTSTTTLDGVQAKESSEKPATVKDALPLLPGIVRARDGTVSIAGYGENHSALLVNSVDVTDPATGAFGLTVPIDSVDMLSVAEMPYLAQYGRFTAGVVNAETRRGEDKWKFSLNDPLPEFRIRSGHLAGLSTATPRLNLSGPVIAGKLYFLEGFEYLLNKQAVRTLPFPYNQTTSRAVNSFTQFDAILSPAQMLTVSYHFAPHSLTHAGLDCFNPEPVTPDIDHHESTGTIADRWEVGGGLLQSTLAMTHNGTDIQPQGSASMVLNPLGNQGNYFGRQSRAASRLEWLENWTPRMFHFAGDHTLQLGSVLAHSQDEGQTQARPVLIEDATGHLISRIDFSGGGRFAVSDVEPAVYAQDHWSLNSHFALDGGLRLEGQTITHTLRTAPRGGFVWSPDHQQKMVLRGGMGVFYDYVPLNVYAFNRYPQQTITTYSPAGTIIGTPVQFVNLTGQEAQSQVPFVGRGASGGNFEPYSVAWNVEAQRTVTAWLMLRLKYLQSHAHDLLTIQPEVVQGRNALALGGSGFAQTRQWEFTARLGTQETRQFFFSYVRQYARGDVSGASDYLGDLPFPIVRQNLIASLPSEIPNRFLLWGAYRLPRKFRVAPKVEYRNGFPYQPVNVLQQYLVSNSEPQHRFPRYFSLDARVSKDIQISSKHAIRLSATVKNLTNHFNPLEVHSNVADPSYGTFFGNYNRKLLFDFDFLF